MKITLQNTDKIVTVNGQPARIWEGTTAAGTPCFAIIQRIACPIDAQAAEFERELVETMPMRAEMTAAIPTRLVL